MVFTRPLVSAPITASSNPFISKQPFSSARTSGDKGGDKGMSKDLPLDDDKENIAPLANQAIIITGTSTGSDMDSSVTSGTQPLPHEPTFHHQRIFSTTQVTSTNLSSLHHPNAPPLYSSSRKSTSSSVLNPFQLVIQLQSIDLAAPSNLLCNNFPYSIKQGTDDKSITVSVSPGAGKSSGSSSFPVMANKVIDSSNLMFSVAEQLEGYTLGSGGVSFFSLSDNCLESGSPGSGTSPEFMDLLENTLSMLFDGMEGRKSARMSVRPVHWSQAHFEPRLQYSQSGSSNAAFAARSSFIDRFAINDNPSPLLETMVESGNPISSRRNSSSSRSSLSQLGLKLDPSYKHAFWLTVIQIDKYGNYYDAVRGLSVPISGDYQDCEDGRQETILKDLKYEFLEALQPAIGSIEEILHRCNTSSGFKKPEATVVTLHGIRIPKNETESFKNASILRVNLVDVSASIFPVLLNTTAKQLNVKKMDSACSSLMKLVKEDIKDSTMYLSVPRQCKDSSVIIRVLKTLAKGSRASTKSRNPLGSISLSFKRNGSKKSSNSRATAFDLFDLKQSTSATVTATESESGEKIIKTPAALKEGKGPLLNTEIPSIDCDFLEEIHRELESMGTSSILSESSSTCVNALEPKKSVIKSGGVLVMPAVAPATPLKRVEVCSNGSERKSGSKTGAAHITKTTALTTSGEVSCNSSSATFSPPSISSSSSMASLAGAATKKPSMIPSKSEFMKKATNGMTTDEDDICLSSGSGGFNSIRRPQNFKFSAESPSSINLSPSSDLSRTKSEYQMQEFVSQLSMQKSLLAERESQIENLSVHAKEVCRELSQEKSHCLRLEERVSGLEEKLKREREFRADEIRIRVQEARESLEKEFRRQSNDIQKAASREIHELKKRVEEEIQAGILIKMDYEVALNAAKGDNDNLRLLNAQLERKIESLENQFDIQMMQSQGQKPPKSLLQHRVDSSEDLDHQSERRPTSNIFNELESTIPKYGKMTPSITQMVGEKLKKWTSKISGRKNGQSAKGTSGEGHRVLKNFASLFVARKKKEEEGPRRRNSDLPPKIPPRRYNQYEGVYHERDLQNMKHTRTRVKGPIMPTKTGGVSVVFTDIKKHQSDDRDHEMRLQELFPRRNSSSSGREAPEFGNYEDEEEEEDYEESFNRPIAPAPKRNLKCSEYLMMDDEARKPKRETVMNMFNNNNDGEESRNKILDGNLNFDSYNSFVPEQKPTFKLGLFKHGGENGDNNDHFSADVKAFSAVDNSHSTSQVHNPIYLTTNARNLLEEIINGSGDLDTPQQQIPIQPEQQMDGSERKQRILEQMRNAEFNMMEGNYFSL